MTELLGGMQGRGPVQRGLAEPVGAPHVDGVDALVAAVGPAAASGPAGLCEPFCGYCGQRPLGGGRDADRRVCSRCGLGMLLRAPRGKAPRVGDPFLIVDSFLAVQAISRRAEYLLGVDEPDVVRAPLDKVLQPADGALDRLDLELTVSLAANGGSSATTFVLRADSALYETRVISCGDPMAALLVLTPLTCAE